MASEYTITVSHDLEDPLPTVYFVIRRSTDGYAWNGTAFEAFDEDHWATYVQTLDYLGGGMWRKVIASTTLPTGGTYAIHPYRQAGEAPAPADLRYTQAIRTIEDWGLPDDASGAGDILVDHDTGGDDTLRYVDSEGNGIEADVTAYLTSEYGAGATPRGSVRTGSDGRWLSKMKLYAGAYTFAFDAPGFQLATVEQEVS